MWKIWLREVIWCFGIVSGLIIKGNYFKGCEFSVYDILVVIFGGNLLFKKLVFFLMFVFICIYNVCNLMMYLN